MRFFRKIFCFGFRRDKPVIPLPVKAKLAKKTNISLRKNRNFYDLSQKIANDISKESALIPFCILKFPSTSLRDQRNFEAQRHVRRHIREIRDEYRATLIFQVLFVPNQWE